MANSEEERSSPCPQAPPKLISLNLLRDSHLSINRHLIPSMRQRDHEVQIHTMLRPIAQLLHGAWNASENIPLLLATAHSRCQVCHLPQGKGRRHAERLGPVVEVRQEVHWLAGEGFRDAWLVHAIERAWCQCAGSIFLENTLGKATALCRGANLRAGHVNFQLAVGRERSEGMVRGDGHLGHLRHAGTVAWVDNGLLVDPLRRAGGLVRFVQVGEESGQDSFAGGHQAVAQVGVLVERELAAAEVELVLVVTVGELVGHAAGLEALEARLEDDLSRAAAKIEHCGCFVWVGAANLSEQVVGRDPGIHTLVRAVHDRYAVLFTRDNGEGVLRLKTVADRLEDLLGLLGADEPQAGRGLYRDRAAALQFFGHDLDGLVQELVQATGSGFRIVLVGAETAALALNLGSLLEQHLSFELRGGTAIVELVDVDTRAGAAGVDHEHILDERLVLGVGARALFSTEGGVNGLLARLAAGVAVGVREVDAGRGEVVEENEENKNNGARLEVTGALRLGAPGGLHLDQQGRFLRVTGGVAGRLLVGIVGGDRLLFRRLGYRRSSHRRRRAGDGAVLSYDTETRPESYISGGELAEI